ncbi:MAG: M1 family metallopeptidase [Balneolaceae bacterium]
MMSLKQIILLSSIAFLTACRATQTTTDPAATEAGSYIQPERPIPYLVEEPLDFQQAVQNGTRSFDGKPGPEYFTNYAEYIIDAEISPADTMLHGRAQITYTNNSPDTLNVLVFELAQNLHKEGMPRMDAAEITGGMNISRVASEGVGLSEVNRFEPGFVIQGTNLIVVLNSPLLPNQAKEVEINWNFKVPQAGASGRMGYSQENLFFIAYWFPHISTYDDLQGWFADTFTGNAEFYHDFGNYQINITAPENWLVMSTGDFLNPEEVLTPQVYERYQNAAQSDEVITIVSRDDFGNTTTSSEDGTLTWRFTAENVRDAAFSATLESQWDALRTPVGDVDGDGETDFTQINAFWRQSAPLWEDAAEYTAHSISFLSEYTGISYPWPHMTSVEGAGIIGGGMEFPMMTVIGGYNNRPTEALYDVVAHEIAHMWIPMIVSSNERRHAWMDEGSTTFHEANARWDIFPDSFDRLGEFNSYLGVAGTPFEGEIMRWSDYHYPGPAYGVASYPKPGTVLFALQGVLGEDVFEEAWQTFMDRWAYKHPTPYDMFNTFEDVSGKDLNWFWRSWYFETWVLDQAVFEVTQDENEATIVISDHGKAIMPVDLTITLEDGTEIQERIDVDDWLKGLTDTSITIKTPSPVISVEIDVKQFYPDMNRLNNSWKR